MADTNDTRPEIKSALEHEDAVALAERATAEELDRLKSAEQLLELRHGRIKRSKRLAQIAQALVGYVALAGFFANAYQNYNNKKQSDEKATKEEERWAKEFKRSQDADKYRAFFETSALATDPTNSDRRLVGYALLKEFVDDKSYDSKAIIMLEESLALELRSETSSHGLDEQRELAVVAILDALSHTADCKVLAQAARSVEKVTHRVRRKATTADDTANLEEGVEVYSLYVRRLLGRATTACTAPKDFREVRRPLADALEKVPALSGPGASAKLKPSEANARIAQLLFDGCEEDAHSGALVDCAEEKKGYARLCAEMASLPPAESADELAACALTK